jgi:uncharacterized protein YjdB
MYYKAFLSKVKVASIILTLFLAGCDEKEDAKVALKSITVSPAAPVSLAIGDTHRLSATPEPADAADVNIKWTSSNTTVASVSDDGLVTAKAEGEATVKASSGDINSAPVAVTVTLKVLTSFTVTPAALNDLHVGDADVQLVITKTPEDAGGSFTYTSGNLDVVTVSDAGRVHVVGAGATAITVASGSLTQTVPVQVSLKPLVSFTVTPAALNDLHVGDADVQLVITKTPEDAGGSFIYTSGNLDVVTVSDAGRVHIVGAGATAITVASGNLTQTVPVKVTDKNAAEFNFEKGKWTIAGFSDQEPGSGDRWGLASNIIDDDVTTFWHSQVVGAQPPMPHWITVDMQSEKTFDGFYFVQTQEMSESGLAKSFRFEISSDNNSWTNVLEGEFSTSRARQEFAFARQVTARYFKITILSGYLNAFWSQFAEIDLYNELNVSGTNGSIALDVLVNAKRPFQGENPLLWEGRMQQLVGWTHNPSDLVSFATDEETTMIIFSIPGAIPYVTNGKVYQTVTLQRGNYTLVFLGGRIDGNVGVTAYGVVTTQPVLPDITAVSVTQGVLGYAELSAIPVVAQRIPFSLTATASVTIGWVYNTTETPHGWTTMYMNGIELYKDY